MPNPNAGRFCWHELMTKDVAVAKRFYTSLFGWTVQEMPMGPAGTYNLFQQNGENVAGMMKLDETHIPPHWLVYVSVDSADTSAKTIEKLGGKIVHPPTTVPDRLRFAVGLDPQGAAFGVLEPMGPVPDDPSGPGAFVWDELHAKDMDAAEKFYSQLFGWGGKLGTGEMKYLHWQNAGKEIGGLLTVMNPSQHPAWLSYVGATDVDASTKNAESLGAKILMPATEMPKVGKFSIVQDPTGAVFALFRSARM